MARPSRNIDQRLLDAGLELLPQTGCRSFSVRQLVEHAGVNLGMFHYHFKTKENFVRAVLERMYEEMFSELALQVNPALPALTGLRNLLRTLAKFARKHRLLMVRLVSETMSGERLPADFLKRNVPRHLKLIAETLARGQCEGNIVPGPVPMLVAFAVGAVAGPLLMGSALEQHGLMPAGAAAALRTHVVSEAALNARIDLAIRALQRHTGEELQ
ncbi:MAG: TetR/AcrR family transcriptional regulator [Casimicrobiaceae bacterium]